MVPFTLYVGKDLKQISRPSFMSQILALLNEIRTNLSTITSATSNHIYAKITFQPTFFKIYWSLSLLESNTCFEKKVSSLLTIMKRFPETSWVVRLNQLVFVTSTRERE